MVQGLKEKREPQKTSSSLSPCLPLVSSLSSFRREEFMTCGSCISRTQIHPSPEEKHMLPAIQYSPLSCPHHCQLSRREPQNPAPEKWQTGLGARTFLGINGGRCRPPNGRMPLSGSTSRGSVRSTRGSLRSPRFFASSELSV